MTNHPFPGQLGAGNVTVPDRAGVPLPRMAVSAADAAGLPEEADAPVSFRPDVQWFEDLLWSEGVNDDVRPYALIDGFWAKGLYGRLRRYTDLSWGHMFQGGVALRRIQDAPFLIALKPGHPLNRWLIEEGWGKGWGVFFTASTSEAVMLYGKPARPPPMFAPSNEEEIRLGNLTEGLDDPLWAIRGHFRRFTFVEFEDDARVVRFRYYDPAALRTYLPTCNDDELLKFFGPVRAFYAEGFNAVERLNAPEDIYRFRRLRSFRAGPGEPEATPLLESVAATIPTGKVRSVARSSAADYQRQREKGLYPMIRNHQIDAFKFESRTQFVERAIQALEAAAAAVRLPPPKNIRDFVDVGTAKARGYGLRSQRDIIFYVLCTFLLGPGFDAEQTPAHAVLSGKSGDKSGFLKQLHEKSLQDAQATSPAMRAALAEV